MRKLIVLCFFFEVVHLVGLGQNLVMNPSFEDTLNDCDSIHYYICQHWVNPNGQTTEYFGSNSSLLDCYGPAFNTPQSSLGYQIAQNGTSYLGMMLYNQFANGKDFAQGFLSQPMIQNLRGFEKGIYYLLINNEKEKMIIN
ncbi:MAG: hypothetical protein K0R65_683 [Crocinitomicaceae bacterium]|jgi:hypothetical protein|nr:hypothetical protein [Crocinitomicaceae bacterium]